MKMAGRRILYQRDDPHAVYFRIYPFLDVSSYRMVRRGLMGVSSDIRLIRLCLVMMGDMSAFSRALLCREKTVFISEASAVFSLIVLFPLNIIFRKKIVVNINHNFNNKIDRLIIAQRFKGLSFAFIEPTPQMLEIYPHLIPVRVSATHASKIMPIIKIFVFLGSRAEQWDSIAPQMVADLNKLIGNKVELVFSGGPTGSRLGNQDYEDIFKPGSGIVLLYNQDSYEFRHSGIVLEAIVCGIPIFMRHSTLCHHYIDRSFPVRKFSDVRDLSSLVARTYPPDNQ